MTQTLAPLYDYEFDALVSINLAKFVDDNSNPSLTTELMITTQLPSDDFPIDNLAITLPSCTPSENRSHSMPPIHQHLDRLRIQT